MEPKPTRARWRDIIRDHHKGRHFGRMTKTYSVKDPEAVLQWCRWVRVEAIESSLASLQPVFDHGRVSYPAQQAGSCLCSVWLSR